MTTMRDYTRRDPFHPTYDPMSGISPMMLDNGWCDIVHLKGKIHTFNRDKRVMTCGKRGLVGTINKVMVITWDEFRQAQTVHGRRMCGNCEKFWLKVKREEFIPPTDEPEWEEIEQTPPTQLTLPLGGVVSLAYADLADSHIFHTSYGDVEVVQDPEMDAVLHIYPMGWADGFINIEFFPDGTIDQISTMNMNTRRETC